jgi:SAM-dependent methyltransferase
MHLAQIEPRKVAEIGCGAGAILAELHRCTTASLHGFDISPQAIAAARKNQGIEFTLGPISGSYDLVLAIDVFEHVEDVFGFLRDLRKHGTSFIFHVPLDMNVHALLRRPPMANRKKVGHLHYFNKDTALATLEESGYQPIHWFYTPVVDLYPGVASRFGECCSSFHPIGQYRSWVCTH